jgi:hypothetical protein
MRGRYQGSVGASTSAAAFNVTADPTNPGQSRGIIVHWQLNLKMFTPDN